MSLSKLAVKWSTPPIGEEPHHPAISFNYPQREFGQKSYLRSTMNQERLNHLMTIHIHKQLTNELDLISLANQFVAGNTHRLTIFGTFTLTDAETS